MGEFTELALKRRQEGKRAGAPPVWKEGDPVRNAVFNFFGVAGAQPEAREDWDRRVLDAGGMMDAIANRIRSGIQPAAAMVEVLSNGGRLDDAGTMDRAKSLMLLFPELASDIIPTTEAVPGPKPSGQPVGRQDVTKEGSIRGAQPAGAQTPSSATGAMSTAHGPGLVVNTPMDWMSRIQAVREKLYAGAVEEVEGQEGAIQTDVQRLAMALPTTAARGATEQAGEQRFEKGLLDTRLAAEKERHAAELTSQETRHRETIAQRQAEERNALETAQQQMRGQAAVQLAGTFPGAKPAQIRGFIDYILAPVPGAPPENLGDSWRKEGQAFALLKVLASAGKGTDPVNKAMMANAYMELMSLKYGRPATMEEALQEIEGIGGPSLWKVIKSWFYTEPAGPKPEPGSGASSAEDYLRRKRGQGK